MLCLFHGHGQVTVTGHEICEIVVTNFVFVYQETYLLENHSK
jgi:hypothetical protein